MRRGASRWSAGAPRVHTPPRVRPPSRGAAASLQLLRQSAEHQGLPVLAGLTRAKGEGLRELPVEDFIRSHDDLVRRVEAALQARRLLAREERARQRIDALLEITQ